MLQISDASNARRHLWLEFQYVEYVQESNLLRIKYSSFCVYRLYDKVTIYEPSDKMTILTKWQLI